MMEITQKKSSIYPKNFFDSEDEEDEEHAEEQHDVFKSEIAVDTAGRLSAGLIEQAGGSFNGRVITIKTEGDQLLTEPAGLVTGTGIPKKQQLQQKQQQQQQQQFQTGNKPMKLELDIGIGDIDINHDSSIESGLESRYYGNKVMTFDYSMMILAAWELISLILYSETDFAERNVTVSIYCLWLMLVCTSFQLVITFIRYQTLLEMELSQKLITFADNMYTTKKFKSMIFEMFILLLQPYPFLNDLTFTTYDYIDELKFEFKFNWLLTIFGWLRIYIIVRVILKSTNYMNTRASRISRMYGCSANYQYVVKCLFKDYPIILSVVVFFCSVIVFGYCLYICERPLTLALDPDNQTFLFDSIQNSIWCVIITMTTIGYGDFFPKTMLGRCVDIILTIWGAFVVSIMVVVLNNALEMDAQEKRSLLLLKRLETRKSLRKSAALLLSAIAKYNNIEKSAKLEGKFLTKQYYLEKALQIRDYTSQFRDTHKQLKAMNEEDNIAEEMSREFDFIREEVKVLNEQQEKLCKYIEDNFEVQG